MQESALDWPDYEEVCPYCRKSDLSEKLDPVMREVEVYCENCKRVIETFDVRLEE